MYITAEIITYLTGLTPARVALMIITREMDE